MNNYPLVCIDNFYNDPDSIRSFALTQQYYNSPGNYPGNRTEQLHIINEQLYDQFSLKLMSLYNIKSYFKIFTCFWKVTTIDLDPNSPKNLGWIHRDGCSFAGVVYLTPGFDKNLGTTIYKQDEPSDVDVDTENTNAMLKFYSSREDVNFDSCILKNNSKYTETAKVYNVYNRLVSFDGDTPHGPSHYYMGEEVRLVQVFFVHVYDYQHVPPLQKIKSFAI